MDLTEEDLLHDELDKYLELKERYRRKLFSAETEDDNEAIRESYEHIDHKISEIVNNLNKLAKLEVKESKQNYPVGLPPFMINELNPVMSLSETVDWGVAMLEIQKIHALGFTGRGIRIAVIGTGVDPDHPDLAGAIEKTFNTTNEPYSSSNGHENGSTGVIAARKNDVGVLGVAPECKIIAIKALSESGSGNMIDIVEAINIAINERVHIINLSLGGGNTLPDLKTAIDRAVAQGIVVVSSAGNSGTDNSVGYPAKYPAGFAVASINRSKKISSFSSRGPEVDIAAPGEKILTCWKDKGYATVSGTSFSAPFVSGCFALFLQAGIKPSHDLLQSTSTDIEEPGHDHKSGYGLINPFAIITGNKPPVNPPTTPPVTPPANKTCATPVVRTDSVTSNSLTLLWDVDNTATLYYIDSKRQGEGWKGVKSTSDSSISVTGLTADTVYEFRVRRVCGSGRNESEFGTTSVKTKSATTKPPIVKQCSTPDFKYHSITSNSVILSWDSYDGPASYVIDLRRNNPDEAFRTVANITNKNSLELTGLVADTEYQFRIKRQCGDGQESGYATISAKTSPISFPPNPPKLDILKVKQAHGLLDTFLKEVAQLTK